MSETGESVPSVRPSEITQSPQIKTGEATISLLREKLAGQAKMKSYPIKLESLHRNAEASPPTEPSEYMYNLLPKSLPEEERREIALNHALISYELRKANAVAALAYLEILEDEKASLENLGFLKEAIPVYMAQFKSLVELLGVDLNQESALPGGRNLIDNYRRGLTPIPQDLSGLFFGEETQATAALSNWENGHLISTWGPFFQFQTNLGSDSEIKIIHENQGKMHEDFHVLVVNLKGERNYELTGMIGEGFAPIIELWYSISTHEGDNVLTPEGLEYINKGLSPLKPRGCDSEPSDESGNFWEKTRAEHKIIKETSWSLEMSHQIMRLLRQNPELTFQELFRVYTEAESVDGFFDTVKGLESVSTGFSEFKKEMGRLIKKPRFKI